MDIKTLYQKFCESNYNVTTDTRKLTKGSIFFALKGASFNGNLYAEEALKKGASCVVVDDEQYVINEKTIFVKDVLETLQQLANYHRNQLQIPIIAITGSNGKTTTKELVNSVLSQSFNVAATRGNLNNHIGVPLSLLSIKPETDIAIIEMGANHPKEIEFLCKIAEPDFGYITNFGKAHLEGFGNLQGVINAKTELYKYLISKNKTIFYNADDAIQVQNLGGYNEIFSFGRDGKGKANIQYDVVSTNPTVTLSYNETLIESQLLGLYNIPNIAIAVAVGRYFKMSSQAIARGVKAYLPDNNRSQIIKKNSNKIILDAYNANPTSMRAAIQNILGMTEGKKVLILGDMRELGDSSEQEHQEIVDLLSENNWDCVCLLGEEFSKTKTEFNKFLTIAELAKFVKKANFKKSTLLIKGSRSMTLERILEYL